MQGSLCYNGGWIPLRSALFLHGSRQLPGCKVDQLFSQIGAAPQIAMETEEDAVVAGLVAAGFGIAVLPEDPLFRSLPLAVISLTDPDPARTAYLSRRRGTRLPEASRRFYEFCCRKLEEPAP